MAGASILIVDDEPEIRELLQIMLGAEGYTVACAENGKDAVRVIANRSFDVVITDLLMPERDGLEFITDLRRTHPKVKIIAMSGGGHIARDSYLKIAKGFGAHLQLEKPFSHEQMTGAIKAVLLKK